MYLEVEALGNVEGKNYREECYFESADELQILRSNLLFLAHPPLQKEIFMLP